MSGAHRGSEPVLHPPEVQHATRRDGWDEPMPLAMSSWTRAFPGTPRQVRAARRFVASLLDGSPLCDDAVLVVSELFTNALLHTDSGKPGGLVVVQVSRWPLGVRVAVTDQGSSKQPVIADRGPCREPAESGHGLYLVGHLAKHLDWHDDPSGLTICAILGTRPPERPKSRTGSRSSPPGPDPVRVSAHASGHGPCGSGSSAPANPPGGAGASQVLNRLADDRSC
jgi:serine/threonine-protein kinase RsbW